MTPDLVSTAGPPGLAGPRSGIATALLVGGVASALTLAVAAAPALRPAGGGYLDILLSVAGLSTLASLLASALAGTAMALFTAVALAATRAGRVAAVISSLASLTLLLPVGVTGFALACLGGDMVGLAAAGFLVALPHAIRQLRVALPREEIAALGTARDLGAGPLVLAGLVCPPTGPGLPGTVSLVLARALAEHGTTGLLIALAGAAGMAAPSSLASVEAAMTGSLLLAAAFTLVLGSRPALLAWLPGPFTAIFSVGALAALLAGAALLLAASVTGDVAPGTGPVPVAPPGLRLLSICLLAAAGLALPAALLAGIARGLARLAVAADSIPRPERQGWSTEVATMALGVSPITAALRVTFPGLLHADPLLIVTTAVRGIAEFLLALHVFSALATTAGVPVTGMTGLHESLLTDIPLLLTTALLVIAIGAGRRLAWRHVGIVHAGKPNRT